MSNCYLSQKVDETEVRHRCEAGFMGRTHATSAVAIFLVGIAFYPALTREFLGTENIWLIVLAAIATAGASLVPDLDNTSSTARNSLGPVGHIMSEGFRVISVIVQTTIRSRKDDPEPNAHRGFFHTIPASAMLGAIVYYASKIPGKWDLPLLGKTERGDFIAILVVFALFHLAISGLAKPLVKKAGKQTPFGELAVFAFSFTTVLFLFRQVPDIVDYQWLGAAIFAGCLIHILGDACTTAGVPLLFPFKRKGKRWWMVRFSSIKAGGVVENVVFVPVFTIMIIMATLRIVQLY